MIRQVVASHAHDVRFFVDRQKRDQVPLKHLAVEERGKIVEQLQQQYPEPVIHASGTVEPSYKSPESHAEDAELGNAPGCSRRGVR